MILSLSLNVILLSSSVLGMVCIRYSFTHDIVFNSKKFVCTLVEKLHNTLPFV